MIEFEPLIWEPRLDFTLALSSSYPDLQHTKTTIEPPYFSSEQLHHHRHSSSKIPKGFWSEVEWSLFKQHPELEPHERQRKMGSLPTSFTPLSLMMTGRSNELEGTATTTTSNNNNSNLSSSGCASDSMWLRKSESLNATPSSQYLFNDPTNNNLPSSFGKLFPLGKGKDIFQEEDEKENWLGASWNNTSTTPASAINNKSLNESNVKINNTLNNSINPSKTTSFFWNNICNSSFSPSIGINNNSEKRTTYTSLDSLSSSQIPNSNINTTVATTDNSNSIMGSDVCNIAQRVEQENSKGRSGVMNLPFRTTTTTTERTDTSSSSNSFSQYEDWKSKLSQWDDEDDDVNIHDDDDDDDEEDDDIVVVDEELDEQTCNEIVESEEMLSSTIAQQIETLNQYEDSADVNQERIKKKPKDDMDTLLTFMSKFDSKIAAIWGGSETRQPTAAALTSENPWSVITANSNLSSLLQQEKYSHQPVYDFRSMQMQIQQHEALLQQQQQQNAIPIQAQDQPKNKRIAIGTNRISPPKGKYTIMHSMRIHFGTAPPEEDYHIFRKTEVGSSEEEKMKSLNVLNHSDFESGFKQFRNNDFNNQGFISKTSSTDSVLPSSSSNSNRSSYYKGGCWNEDIAAASGSSEVDIDFDYDEELEIVAACSKQKIKALDAPPEDLLNSWKTHFRTVDVIESKEVIEVESTPQPISSHQINPHLPNFIDHNPMNQDYVIYKQSADTTFPVRFKIDQENDKANQTESFFSFFPSSSSLTAALSARHNPHLSSSSNYEWSEMYSPNSHVYSSSTTSNQFHPQQQQQDLNETPTYGMFDYELSSSYDANAASSWVQDENVFEDYDSSQVVAGNEYAPAEYDYYDEMMFGDYEYDGTVAGSGDYEYLGAEGGMMILANDGSDTDYGHFQEYQMTPSTTSSSTSKKGKASRRRAARVRPCKYFFLEGSCRRGADCKCKFSHDLITCRYWSEGSCLKGPSCPFLHCFIDRKQINDQEFGASKLLVEDKKYQLESESDFPTLGSTNAMISSRVPMSQGFSSSTSINEEGAEGYIDIDSDTLFRAAAAY